MAAVNGNTKTSGTMNGSGKSPPSRLYTLASPSLAAFRILCEQPFVKECCPLCSSSEANVPIYDLSEFSATDVAQVNSLQDEWYHILESGPGVVVLKHFFHDQSALLSRVNSIYDAIIQDEQTTSTSKGDHFAASGKNSRIWNSFQKHAQRDPDSFIPYYSNPWLAHMSEAWLGPAYQMTAQVNVVRPGGKPQVAHRDYHLGFQTAQACGRFPRAMQVASQLLTLQGAVAHSDMPLASGPTRFLPFSQKYEAGYMAYRLPEFTEYFDEHWISVPLQMGDAVFFNPALFHAAGENKTSDVHRSANLLQVSSAFGKTMETINNQVIMEACFEQLSGQYRVNEGWTLELECIVKTVSSGYPFPTNLDRQPPAPGGMAPASETDILMSSIERGLSKADFVDSIRLYKETSSP